MQSRELLFFCFFESRFPICSCYRMFHLTGPERAALPAAFHLALLISN